MWMFIAGVFVGFMACFISGGLLAIWLDDTSATERAMLEAMALDKGDYEDDTIT